jgi:FkbM family methyltransferase
MRTVAERTSRGRRLKRRLGDLQIFVSPDSALSHLKPTRSAFGTLLGLAEEFVRENYLVWDIGANVGVFAFSAAQRTTNRVIAVEPDPFLVETMMLTMGLRSNRDLPVTIVAGAVAAHNGIESLVVAARGRSSNALASAGGRSQMGGVRGEIDVPTITLDTLREAYGQPDLIKVDVEGAELAVLEGAELVLGAGSIWIIEVGDTARPEISNMFISRDYVLFDADQRAKDRVPLETCAWNSIAIPSGSPTHR